MPAEIRLESSLLWGFLLALARVSGLVALAPVPGWRQGPDLARVALAVALTAALYPVWPSPPKQDPGLGEAAVWIAAEMSVGLVVGLALSLLTEGFVLASQIFGLQAGYSYASTIDPTSQADSAVLQVLAQLAASLLFFSFRLEEGVLRALASSFERYPPGQWQTGWTNLEGLIGFGSAMWTTALRLALPVVALLLMLDVALALVSRVNAQLQLLALAFPAKMLATLAMLALLAGSFPIVFRQQAERFVALVSR
ncbi:MAG: flagellar biosynthetic protein FliR [Acidobacteria bacterium]|nr:flagellar biosynthetic protein FliR [Acidobacteriota bacterium]